MSTLATLRAIPRLLKQHDGVENPPRRPPRRLLWWRRSIEEQRALREWKLWNYAFRRLGFRRVAWEWEVFDEAGETGRSVRRLEIVLDD